MPNLERMTRTRKDLVFAKSMADAPTESRPNHMAMLAGFPEELSNIYNGWKKNGQEFDHLLKRANAAYAFGGPDVVEFFHGPNVKIKGFPYERYRWEIEPSNLDVWVVNEYEALLKDADDSDDDERLKKDGLVIFLHLAGIDTNGHRHGALSMEYSRNARVVDDLIERIQSLTRMYFGDDEKTMYIFTSDHGFPDVGGHGTTDIHARSCPFVVWGIPSINSGGGAVESLEIKKIKQQQIAPWAATMLGLAIPLNSIVSLPLVLLNGDWDLKSRALAIASNHGQLAMEMCSQQKSLSRSSLIGAIMTNGWGCQSEMQKLKKFEKANDDHKEILYLTDVQRVLGKRMLIRSLRFIFAIMPFILGNVFLSSSKDMGQSVSRPWTRIFLTVILALVWFLIGFRTLVGLLTGLAFILSITFFGGSIAAAEFVRSIFVALITASVLWSPKLAIVPFIVAAYALLKKTRVNAVKFLLLSAGLLLPLFSPKHAVINDLVNIIGITFILRTVNRRLLATDGSFRYLDKFMTAPIGLYLKSNLFFWHFMPLLHRPFSLVFIAAYSATCMILWQRCKGRDESKTKDALLMNLLLVWLTGLIDSTFVYSITLVLFYWCIKYPIDDLGFDRRTTGEIEMFASMLILVLGPWLISSQVFNPGYQLGVIGRMVHMPTMIQIPLGSVVGVTTLALFVKCQLLEMDWDLILCRLGRMISQVVPMILIIMMLIVPHKESWLEIGIGVARVLVVSGLSLILYAGILLFHIIVNK